MATVLRQAMTICAQLLAIISLVGCAGFLGEAHADPPNCADPVSDQCPQTVDQPSINQPPGPKVKVFCRSLGPKGGARCYQRQVP